MRRFGSASLAVLLVASVLTVVPLGPLGGRVPEAGAQTAAGVTFSTTAITVGEFGGHRDGSGEESYTIVLDTKPTHDVEIGIQSSDTNAVWVKTGPGTGERTDNAITFTPSDWNVAQEVTARGRNDNINNPDDKRTATFMHTATSDDASYNGLDIEDVIVTVTDDDTAGVSVSHGGRTLNQNEGDGFNYEVKLVTQPTHDVRITVTPADSARVKVGPTVGPAKASHSITFTPTTWDRRRTIRVTPVADKIVPTRSLTRVRLPTSASPTPPCPPTPTTTGSTSRCSPSGCATWTVPG